MKKIFALIIFITIIVCVVPITTNKKSHISKEEGQTYILLDYYVNKFISFGITKVTESYKINDIIDSIPHDKRIDSWGNRISVSSDGKFVVSPGKDKIVGNDDDIQLSLFPELMLNRANTEDIVYNSIKYKTLTLRLSRFVDYFSVNEILNCLIQLNPNYAFLFYKDNENTPSKLDLIKYKIPFGNYVHLDTPIIVFESFFGTKRTKNIFFLPFAYIPYNKPNQVTIILSDMFEIKPGTTYVNLINGVFDNSNQYSITNCNKIRASPVAPLIK